MLTSRRNRKSRCRTRGRERVESRGGLPSNDFRCAAERHSRWCDGPYGAGVGRSGTACDRSRVGTVRPDPGDTAGVHLKASTRLLDTAHATYGELPNGSSSLDTMLCESVFRALLSRARAEDTVQIDPVALRRVLGSGGRRRSRRSTSRSGWSPTRARPATGSPRWRGVVSTSAPSRRRCLVSTGVCVPIRAPQDRENPCAAVEVPRPRPRQNPGCPMPPGIRCSGDGRSGRFPGRRVRRLIPELRGTVGDVRRVAGRVRTRWLVSGAGISDGIAPAGIAPADRPSPYRSNGAGRRRTR
jgi:hypothetical protein